MLSKVRTICLAALLASAQGERVLKGKKGKDRVDQFGCVPEEFKYTADKTYREGLGESPGVTAFEYLGTGYNLFEGNPRGGESTELDPGFRGGVIQLEQKQDTLTLDGDYTVPLGTELRYVTSCQFDSKSKEMTSASDYETELKSEASVSTSFGIGFSFLGFSFGASASFSESKKSKSFARDRLETQTTAFEARALCTEFEGKLKKYYDHKTTPEFSVALDTLPPFLENEILDENFDPSTACPRDDNADLNAYGAFVGEYGTHYIIQLLLGAKHVFTTVMKSQDVLRLREQEVEVETALSAKAMFGYSREVEVEASVPVKGVEVSVATTLVTEGTVEGGRQESTYESQRKKSVNELKQKTQTVTEVNIGGTPPPGGDWRTWAATAKDRPMPITYQMSTLADFMNSTTAESFAKAIRCLYRGRQRNLPDFPSGVRFGLADPNGKPISTYSFDPFSDQRTVALLRPPQLTDVNSTTVSPPLFNYDIRWFGSATRVSALFAAPIRDNVAPNVEEDRYQLGFLDDRFTDDLSIRGNLHSFGIFPEPGRSVVGILDYGSFDSSRAESSRSQLNTFGYITADNLGDDGIVAGVVHPQGYAVNREFGVDPRFLIDMQNDHTFYVNLPGSSNINVTFVVFPMWFPSTSKRYPKNSGEIAIGINSCTSDATGARCSVSVGAKQSKIEYLGASNNFTDDGIRTDQFLGFSFLAINDGFNRAGLVHGVIEITPGSCGSYPTVTMASGSNSSSGFSVTGQWSCPAQSYPVSIGNVEIPAGGTAYDISANVATTQVTGGVLIEFDLPFSELPAVFASISDVNVRFENKQIIGGKVFSSPIFDRLFDFEAELVKGPSVVVEHVNERQVFIKAGMVDTCGKQNNPTDTTPLEIYEPKSFHFIAAGPVLQP